MLHRDLESLTPEARKMAEQFLNRCHVEGLNIAVTETKRDLEAQVVYFLRGRIPTDAKNIQLLQDLGAKYAWRFTDGECKRKVTRTLNSNHLSGRALDIAVVNDGRLNWDFGGPEWLRALDIARSVGFSCGADWQPPDYPHLEAVR